MPDCAESDRRQSAYNSGLLGSSTLSTESTAMGDSRDEYCDTTLLLRDLQCMQIPSETCSPKHDTIILSFGLRNPPAVLLQNPCKALMIMHDAAGAWICSRVGRFYERLSVIKIHRNGHILQDL